MDKYPENPKFSVIAALFFAGLASAGAAVSYTTPGTVYQQNFNSLGSTGSTNAWANDSTIPGWHAAQITGATVTNYSTYTASSGGAATQGSLLSVGSAADDRALGGQNANTTAPTLTTMYYALSVSNSTGVPLSAFSLSYVGEQWRFVQNEALDRMNFEYQIFAAGTGSITADSGWTAVSALSYDAPVVSSAASASLDGNAAGNRVTVSATVSGIAWGNGTELWLRWSDSSSASMPGPVPHARCWPSMTYPSPPIFRSPPRCCSPVWESVWWRCGVTGRDRAPFGDQSRSFASAPLHRIS